MNSRDYDAAIELLKEKHEDAPFVSAGQAAVWWYDNFGKDISPRMLRGTIEVHLNLIPTHDFDSTLVKSI